MFGCTLRALVLSRKKENHSSLKILRCYRPKVEALEDRTLLNAGDLDPTFDNDGRAVTDFDSSSADEVNQVAIQLDGKIVVAGTSNSDFALARYNTNGSLDPSFDSDGKVTTDFNSTSDSIGAMVILDNGKILAAGSGGGIAGLARYNSDGSLDTSFDSDGKVTSDFLPGTTNFIRSLAIQSDDKIVVAVGFVSTSSDFGVARYHSDGSLDTGFGNNGLVLTHINGSDSARDLVIEPDGKILVIGSSYDSGANDESIVAARYNSNGTLDTTFGVNGKKIVDFGQRVEIGNAVVRQPDGKFVIAGSVGPISSHNWGLARLHSNGNLDNTFDDDGFVITAISGGEDALNDITLQPDGKILAVGYGDRFVGGTKPDIVVARYNPDGELDSMFGTNGIVQTDIQLKDTGWSIDVQTDGKIVAAGTANDFGSAPDFAVVRYEGDLTDFDDAPASFGTASHIATGPKLGIERDSEPATFDTANADGDDLDGVDDEDGVAFVSSTLIVSSSEVKTGQVQIDLQNADANNNKLDAWIDFNQDGDFLDDGEQIFTNKDLGTSNGVQTFDFAIPAGALAGATFARFRLSTAGSLAPTGAADDGEIEDYKLTLLPELTIDDVTLTEGNSGEKDFTFTVTRSQTNTAVSVNYATADGTAAAGSDFTGIGSTALNFSANGSASKQVTVKVQGDAVVEADETFFVNLSGAIGAAIADGQGQGAITNDDTANLTVSNVTANETDSGTTQFIFHVTLDNDVQGGFAVAVDTSDDTAETSDGDYVASSKSIGFLGTKDESVPFLVTVNGDTKIEPDEKFDVLLGALTNIDPTAADDISKTDGAGTITNDDFPDFDDAPASFGTASHVATGPQLGNERDTETGTFDSANADGDDLDGADDEDGVAFVSSTLTVSSSEAKTGQVQIDLQNADAGANKLDAWIDFNQDGDFLDSGEQIFTNKDLGTSNGVQTLDFAIPAGALAGDTFARFRLSTAGSLAPTGAAGDGEVEDYKLTLLPELTIDNVTLDEGDSGEKDFTFTVTRSQTNTAVSVNYATANGTAAAGSDFTGIGSTALNFSANGSASKQVTVKVQGDGVVEANELFYVNLADASDAVISDGQGLGTITNDDTANLTVSNVTANETDSGTTSFIFHVTLDNDVQGGFAVAVDTSDDTAETSDGDYVTSSKLIGFLGTKDESVPFLVTVNGDTKIEPNEKFDVILGTLSNIDPTAADDITKTNGAGTITNDDIPDYGDAPDPADGTATGDYQTRKADDGPVHTINNNLRIGAVIDTENDGQPTAAADGDDANGDDEDGLVNPVFDVIVVEGQSPEIRVRVTNNTGAAAKLYGWIDYDQNGVFDNATERAEVDVPDGTTDGIVTLTLPEVPADSAGTTYARLRLSTDAAAADPTGWAKDGEVEDYRIYIIDKTPLELHAEYGFYGTGNLYQNYGGSNGRWFRSRLENWLFILPDGSLFVWDGTPATASGEQIAQLAPVYYDDTTLLFDPQSAEPVYYSAEQLKEKYGFYSRDNLLENWGNWQELWFQENRNRWYFLTVSGRLFHWNGQQDLAGSAEVARTDAAVYQDLTLLFPIPFQFTAAEQQQLEDLQNEHEFYFTGDFHRDWLGWDEIWFRDKDDNWHFLIAGGELRRWDGVSLATSAVVANLHAAVFDDAIQYLFGA